MLSGIAARSAACSTGLIWTVGGAVTGATVSRAGGPQAVTAAEVNGARPLAGVGAQPPHQVAEGLARVEQPDRQDTQAVRDGCGVGAGHKNPAGPAGRPETVQIRRVGQVVE